MNGPLAERPPDLCGFCNRPVEHLAFFLDDAAIDRDAPAIGRTDHSMDNA